MPDAREIALRFVLLGHVDHGKSTLGGSILVQTNTVTEREIEKAKIEAVTNKMETWWLAYLLDEDINERLTGKTHQFITREIPINDKYYELIDVPGHQKLITEMIEGVSRADIAVLVCSSRKGELEQGLRGQMYEHCVIARGMAVTKLVVAVNKMDEHDWSMTEFERISGIILDKIKPLRFASVTMIPISALKGENISSRKIPDTPCLFEAITSTTVNPNRIANTVTRVTDTFIADVIFMKLDQVLISRGFECMMHSGGVTIPVMVNRIQNMKYVTVRQEGDTIKVQFKLSTPDLDLKPFFILRLSDTTIGIGRLFP